LRRSRKWNTPLYVGAEYAEASHCLLTLGVGEFC